MTSGTTASHDPSLVVEVAQHDHKTLVLLAQHVLAWNLYIVEGDESGTSGRRVRGLDRFGLDTFSTLNEEDGKTLGGLASDGEVIREVAVGDPFLGAVDGPVGAVSRLLGSASM